MSMRSTRRCGVTSSLIQRAARRTIFRKKIAWRSSSRSIRRARRATTISAPTRSASLLPRAAQMAIAIFWLTAPAAKRLRCGAAARSSLIMSSRPIASWLKSKFRRRDGARDNSGGRSECAGASRDSESAARRCARRADLGVRYAQRRVHHAGRFGKLEDQSLRLLGRRLWRHWQPRSCGRRDLGADASLRA